MTNEEGRADPPVLDYGKGSGKGVAESPWLALLLCGPGAACFVMYFANVGGIGLFTGALFMAVATALASLALYARHRRRALRWYVGLNLAINVAGLLFAAVGLIAVLGEVSVRLARGVRLLSEDQWADVAGLVAAFVVLPVIACLVARISTSIMPGSTHAQARLYGAMTLLFTPFMFVVALLAWTLDRAGIYRSDTPLWWVFASTIWVAVTCGTPYLYLRRRLRKESERAGAGMKETR